MLTLTPTALAHITKSLSQRGHGLGIKIGVKSVGCSGLKYTLEFVDDPLPPTHVVISNLNFSVYIAPDDRQYFDYATLDFVKEGLSEGFKFINPAEKSRCGCGESFKV